MTRTEYDRLGALWRELTSEAQDIRERLHLAYEIDELDKEPGAVFARARAAALRETARKLHPLLVDAWTDDRQSFRNEPEKEEAA